MHETSEDLILLWQSSVIQAKNSQKRKSEKKQWITSHQKRSKSWEQDDWLLASVNYVDLAIIMREMYFLEDVWSNAALTLWKVFRWLNSYHCSIYTNIVTYVVIDRDTGVRYSFHYEFLLIVAIHMYMASHGTIQICDQVWKIGLMCKKYTCSYLSR